jgi:hypothetical protein
MVELFRSPRKLLLFCLEGTLVALTVLVASSLRLGTHVGLTLPHGAKKALLFAAVAQGAFYYAGLYDLAATRHARVVYARTLRGVVLAPSFCCSSSTRCPCSRSGAGFSSSPSRSQRSASRRGASFITA